LFVFEIKKFGANQQEFMPTLFPLSTTIVPKDDTVTIGAKELMSFVKLSFP